jgi:hypothetical protein
MNYWSSLDNKKELNLFMPVPVHFCVYDSIFLGLINARNPKNKSTNRIAKVPIRSLNESTGPPICFPSRKKICPS